MQPTLVLTAAQPGIFYINGRFAGEGVNDRPLMCPVCPTGALYLEYRPLAGNLAGCARRLTLSGGQPLSAAAQENADLNIVCWPGPVIEIEFSPTPAREDVPRRIGAAEREMYFIGGTAPRLEIGGQASLSLPAGAQMPEVRMLEAGTVLLGACDAGSYLVALDRDCRQQTGFLSAWQLQAEADGRIRALTRRDDLVGHATAENWLLRAPGLEMISAEPVWAYGAPRWPDTPEKTARAFVEAALTGLDAEAGGYLSPRLKESFSLADLRARADLCAEMKYAPPDARPCVGLLRLAGAHIAFVTPLYFTAAADGGTQGPYRLESLTLPAQA